MDHKDFIHGGDVYSEGELKGVSLIDYSSNINPFGIPNTFKNEIENILKDVVKYPDFKYRKLKAAIIEYHREYNNTCLEEVDIILGNGAAEILSKSISLSKSILIVAPSFIEYEESALKFGLNIGFSKLDENMNYNYEDIKDKMKNYDALILANPNNPSGNIIDKEKFLEILELCKLKNKLVIVDEAFADFLSNHKSIIKLVENYESLIVVRAITKFFGMPGIRMGYGITKNKRVINKIKSLQDPWNINVFAEKATIISLRDSDYINKSKLWIKEEIEFFFSELKKLKFVEKVYRTNANFVLVKLNGINGEELYRLALEKNYLIRRCSNFRFLDDSYVRFAIKNRTNNIKFLAFLKGIKPR